VRHKLVSLNFTSKNIDVKQYVSQDSKIRSLIVNPITYHATIEIENSKQSLEITVMKLPDGGFNAMINDSVVRGTMTTPLNVAASDVQTAIKNVLANWEKCFFERLEKTK